MRSAFTQYVRTISILLVIGLLGLGACDYAWEKPVDGENPIDTGGNNNTAGTLEVVPSTATIGLGESQQFTAVVTGLTDTSVRWEILSGVGTLSSDGLFTAPASIPSDTVESVLLATANADTTLTATATVRIGKPVVDPNLVCFSRDVLPIFRGNCAISGCHDIETHEEERIYLTYEGITAKKDDIRPGNPNESKIYKMLTDSEPDDRMPPAPQLPLTAEQISTIRRWIEQGAKNEPCVDNGCDTTNVTFSGTVFPIIQTNCIGCHSGANPDGSLALTNYSQIRAAAIDGGFKLDGKLFKAITHRPGVEPMPNNGDKLSDCNISQIRIWIENDAPDN
jgi:hypothetical protein